MNTDTSPAPPDLQQRFPSMRPVKSAPSLFTLNGFGLGMYGKRDLDAKTGLYIKTRCLCAVFIPLIPLDAFRVADAPGGGWYFIGKEKLSGFAKVCRSGIVAAILCAIGSVAWEAHVHSPEYRARKGVEKATELIARGQPLDAAEVYRDLLRQHVGNNTQWVLSISGLLRKEIESGDPSRCAAAIQYADQHKFGPGQFGPLLPDLANLALGAAGTCANVEDTRKILSSFTPSPTDLVKVHEALRKALESLHVQHPAEHQTSIDLALIREEFGEIDGALALLEPAKDKLGSGEGARLYGHLLLNAGRINEALPHLERYVIPRAEDWKNTETALQNAYESARTQALNVLNQSGGPPGFKQRYEAADKMEQQQMVEEHLSMAVEQNAHFLSLRERYQTLSKLVPSIMDLGVVRLRAAQSEQDAAKRTELLKKSESAFLTLKNVAGDTDDYRFFLGQVYFWSGKESDGRKLFDEMLASKHRDFPTLYALAGVYRELGEDDDARKLLDESYSKVTKDNERNMIVRLRSLLARNTDEKIEWLSKGMASDPLLAINLAEARGEKAEQAGDLKGAANHYREALGGYQKQPNSASTANNSAILHQALYRLEGRAEDFESSARLFSEAVELQPANSILSFNSAESLLNAAVVRVAANKLPSKLLQFDASLDSLQFLYENEIGKKQVIDALKSDPNFQKSMNRFWEALLLAPKNTGIYAWGSNVFSYTRDLESMKRLLAKAKEQDFEFETEKDEFAKFLNGERDEELRKSLSGLKERVDKLVDGLNDPMAVSLAQTWAPMSRIGGFSIGQPIDAGGWLPGISRAVENQPCSRTLSVYAVCLETIALEKLKEEDMECRVIIEANRRLIDVGNILRLLVRAKGDLGERVRKHPAVIAARNATSNLEIQFPSSFGLRDWLLLDGLKPDAGDELRRLVNANRLEPIAEQLQHEISIESPSMILGSFWIEIFENHENQAKELQPKLEQAGLKIPPLF